MTTETIGLTDEIVGERTTQNELDFYKDQHSEFQMVLVVANCVYRGVEDGVSLLAPYALSLIPASKRGAVETSDARFIEAMAGGRLFEEGAAYLGMDPFSGEWKLFSQVSLIAEMGASNAYTDELGLVLDHYFLRTDVKKEDIVQPALGIPENKLTKYLRHRTKLLYQPFRNVGARQIWGLENGLELFVFHEIIKRNLPRPVPQALVFADGSWHPSLYHAWQEFGDGDGSDLVTEVDFFFPDKRLALFCDGATHDRKKIKERDAKIDIALKDMGIAPVRIKSRVILKDIEGSVDLIAKLF